MSKRLVGHLDADAFYVAVECTRRPELKGKAVVVAGAGPRAVVTTASYAARKHGVGSAMPAVKARRLCPDGIFIEPDFDAYRKASGQVMEIVRAYSERVEVVGLDEAYLDLSNLSFPHAAMRALVGEIARTTGLTCSVGIGPNKLVAKVASDAQKPAGFVTLTREQACVRFAACAPELIPGVGPKTAARLREMGAMTIAAFAELPEESLRARFGENAGRDLHARARFEHPGEVAQARKVLSASRERTFDRDITERAQLVAALGEMVAELCAGLRKKGSWGRTVAIKVRHADFTTVTRARTLGEPTADALLVGQIARELLHEYDPVRPVRLLGVRLAGLCARGECASARASASGTGRQGDFPAATRRQLALALPD